MTAPSIMLRECSLQLPIYGTINRSLKGAVMASATGGKIASASKNVTVVHALKDISLDIRAGDRVGLVGHNASAWAWTWRPPGGRTSCCAA